MTTSATVRRRPEVKAKFLRRRLSIFITKALSSQLSALGSEPES
jgi:hypothetical protein